jgi:hypothetical protein
MSVGMSQEAVQMCVMWFMVWSEGVWLVVHQKCWDDDTDRNMWLCDACLNMFTDPLFLEWFSGQCG